MPILRVAASSILLKGGCPECGHDISKHMTVIGGGHACLHPDCRRAIDDGFMQRPGQKVRRGDTQCDPCYYRGVEHTESCGTCGHVKEHHHPLQSRKGEACSDCVYDNVKAKREFLGGISEHGFTPMDHLPPDIRDLGKGRRYPEERCKECGHRYRSHAEVKGSVERGRCLYPDCGCTRATRVPEQLPPDIRDMDKGGKTWEDDDPDAPPCHICGMPEGQRHDDDKCRDEYEGSRAWRRGLTRLPKDIREMKIATKSIFVVEEPIVDVTPRSLFEMVVDEPRMMKDGIEKSGPGTMKLRPGERGWMTIRGEGPMSGRPIRAEMGRGMKLRPPTERHKANLGPEIGMREYTPEESKKVRALPHEKAHADDLLKQYRQSTPEQRKRGHNWYPRASQIVDRYAGQHQMPTGKKVGYSRSQISGALAALSPRQNWGENVFMLDRVVRAHQHGTEFKRVRGLGFRGNGQKAWRILGGADPAEVLGERKRTGQKVRAFHHALENFDGKEHADHSKCDQPTVVDQLMDRAMHGSQKPNHRPTNIDGKVYREHSNAVRVAAMRAGVEPWALQATVWTKMNDEGGAAARTHVGAEGQPHMLKLAGVWPGSTKRRKLVLKSHSVWRMTSS